MACTISSRCGLLRGEMLGSLIPRNTPNSTVWPAAVSMYRVAGRMKVAALPVRTPVIALWPMPPALLVIAPSTASMTLPAHLADLGKAVWQEVDALLEDLGRLVDIDRAEEQSPIRKN